LKKPNIVDIIILLFVLSLPIFILARKYSPREEAREFSGLDIIRVCEEYNRISAKGYVVVARVEGKWTFNSTPVTIEGVVVKADKARLYIAKNSLLLSIGGPMADVEHIAASKITLLPQSRSVIVLRTKPLKASSLEEFSSVVYSIAESAAGEYGVATIRVAGRLLLRCNMSRGSPVFQKIWLDTISRIKFGIVYLILEEGYLELSLYGAGWRPEDLSVFTSILSQNGVAVDAVITPSLTIMVGTERSLAEPGAEKSVKANLAKLVHLIETEKVTISPYP